MTAPISAVTPVAAPDTRALAALRRTAEQMEGMFVKQLFAAMRATVPADGAMAGGAGEELFTGMLDESVADSAPAHGNRGLAGQIVAQLRSRLPQHNEGATP
jgi:flagellar protein FlgJ